MITIREIAAVAGVSKTTVWGALRGEDKVASATRERINALAKELGYRPNPAFQQMCRQIRAKRKVHYKSTLGVVHHFESAHPEENNPFHRAFNKGLKEEAERQGFELDYFWTRKSGLSEKRLSDIISARGIQGIIIPASDNFLALELKWDLFAAVAVGFTLKNPHLNRVDADYQQATILCLRYLIDMGYERIGLVLRSDYETWRRYNLSVPYCWYQSASKSSYAPSSLTVGEGDKDLFLNWLKKERFDALIINHVDAIDWCREAGIRIPDDLGIVLSTPTPDPRFANVSGVDYQPEKVGAAAINMLVAQLHRAEFGYPRTPKMMTTRVTWKPGTTTRQIRKPQNNYHELFPPQHIEHL